MLEVEGCSVNFGGIRALRDVSIKVRELEIVGILGFPATWADERRLSRRAGTLAEILGLTPLLDHEVDGLPYGLLKRVELAAVLATDPDLVLLDEPTSGMGPAETDDFAAKLLELRRAFQLTVLMIE